MTLDPKVREEAEEMLLSGMHPMAVYDELFSSLSLPTCYAMRRSLVEKGLLEPLSKKDPFKGIDIAHAIAQYTTTNRPVASICTDRQCRMTPVTFYRLLQETKTPLRRDILMSDRTERMDMAMELYQNTDTSIAEIVATTGIHQPTLHAELHKRGIPLRRPRK